METFFSFREKKKNIVLILPMRNGNRIHISKFYRKIIVLILPMRNGNTYEELAVTIPEIASSYPTYEEWKHLLLSVESFII